MRMRVVVPIVLGLALGGGVVVRGLPDMRPRPDEIPTTRVQRGDVPTEVNALGDLRALRSSALSAPTTGGTLQLVTLLPSGSVTRKDEVVIAFDLGEQRYNLEQARSELEEAEQELAKLDADARVQAAQDQVALLEARYAVRRAELQVSGNEFVGAIEAKKNLLTLEEARRTLAKLEDDVKTHAESSRAALAVLQEKRRKAQLGMEFAQRNIENMTIRAPMDGLVVVKENRDASGGFFMPGMSLPDYRPGDAVQPGRVVAEVVDIRDMELRAKVSETDRPALGTGGAAMVKVEALPGVDLSASTKGVSGLATRNFWEVSATRQFDASFALGGTASALRPGMTARVQVRGDTLKGVLHVPRQVLFERGGKPVVYVRNGTGFTPRPVKVVQVTETRAVVEDLPEDAEIALADPEEQRGTSASQRSSPLPGGAS